MKQSKPRYNHITKRKLCQISVAVLIPLLNLSEWNIKLRFTRRLANIAECYAQPEYKKAEIVVHLIKLGKLSSKEVITMSLHELLHCITWEVTTWNARLSGTNEHRSEHSRQLDEHLQTDLERILYPLIESAVLSRLQMLGYKKLDLTTTQT